jgi:hypothetical protein
MNAEIARVFPLGALCVYRFAGGSAVLKSGAPCYRLVGQHGSFDRGNLGVAHERPILSLQRVDYPRPPALDPKTDYNVLWKGRPIGRMWKHRYDNHPWASKPDWHWYWGTRGGRIEGHAPTLESAMADFRRAWDRTRQRLADQSTASISSIIEVKER